MRDETNISSENISLTSQKVDMITGYIIYRNSPVKVGEISINLCA